jgi:hypothetical protein
MANNRVLLKKSSVSGKVPETSDLQYGEVALNYTDNRLYYKTSSNQIRYHEPIRFASDGSAIEPAFSFENDPDTGMYRIGDNALSLVVGGGDVIRVLEESGSVSDALFLGTLEVDELSLIKKNKPSGDTGDAALSYAAGSVNFGPGDSSVVVTNRLVTPDSVVVATVGSNDSGMKSVSVVVSDGSFELFGDAAPTAETRVYFIVV